MRAVIMVGMLIALLVTAWLVAQSITGPKGESAPVATIDRARDARERSEEAAREMQRRLEEQSKE